MNCLTMPRARKNFLIDERVLESLDDAAKRAGCKSANAFVEQVLFQSLKTSGILGADAKPLKDGRGGLREGAGKKRRSPNDPPDVENHSSKDDGGSSEARSKDEEPIDKANASPNASPNIVN